MHRLRNCTHSALAAALAARRCCPSLDSTLSFLCVLQPCHWPALPAMSGRQRNLRRQKATLSFDDEEGEEAQDEGPAALPPAAKAAAAAAAAKREKQRAAQKKATLLSFDEDAGDGEEGGGSSSRAHKCTHAYTHTHTPAPTLRKSPPHP